MKKTFLISETDLTKLVNRILNESNPILGRIARSILPATRLKFVNNLDNLLTTGKIENVNKSSIVMRDGDEVLTNFLSNTLKSSDMQKVFNSIFRAADDDQTIKVMSEYLLSRPKFVSRYEGMTDLDILNDLTTKYGIKQASVLKNGLLSLRPKVSPSYNMIFGGIPQNEALKIIDNSISKALTKDNFKSLKGIGPKNKEVMTQNPDEILKLILSGNLTDIPLLKKYIINSIPIGPVPPAVNRVKNKIFQSYFTDDYLIPAKAKSVKEIEKNLADVGITNKELASEIWKKVNPDSGVWTGFKKGISSSGPTTYIRNAVWGRQDFKNSDKKLKGLTLEDFNRLIVWGFTGVGDYTVVRQILRTYGGWSALANVGGQYLKSWLGSAFIFWFWKTMGKYLSEANQREQVSVTEAEAWGKIISDNSFFQNSLFAGVLSRLMIELLLWMNEKSVGGKLPVYVYDIQQWIQQQQNKVRENMNKIENTVKNTEIQIPKTTKPDSTATKPVSDTTSNNSKAVDKQDKF